MEIKILAGVSAAFFNLERPARPQSGDHSTSRSTTSSVGNPESNAATGFV